MILYWASGTLLATLSGIGFGIAAISHSGWVRWAAAISVAVATIGWIVIVRAFKQLESM